jgi:hypothetical protein
MFAPTARTTPTRLPWWWSLVAMWLLMALWSPAFANDIEPQMRETPAVDNDDADDGEPMRIGPWQVLSMPQMWRSVRWRPGGGAPRMLPLAVMPTQSGAWMMGLSTSRVTREPRIELRFAIPLDGRRIVLPHERDD